MSRLSEASDSQAVSAEGSVDQCTQKSGARNDSDDSVCFKKSARVVAHTIKASV